MKKPYVAVVGASNLDICGRSAAPLIPCDSNPGTVRFTSGGVGRNIAHNLSLLGLPPVFVTVLGSDPWSAGIEASCTALGMDLRHAVRIPGGTLPTYVYLTDPSGDLALAVCDSGSVAAITPEVLSARMDVLCGAEAVIFDANLSAEAIACLAADCTAPLFADPVSVSKSERLRPVLGRLHTLKPNVPEAERLSGIPIRDEASLLAAADALLAEGLRRVVISLGAGGLLLSEGAERVRLPCYPLRLVNATGGGDALMAALCCGWLRGLNLRDTGRFALAAGKMTVEWEETNNPNLSVSALEAIMKGATR